MIVFHAGICQGTMVVWAEQKLTQMQSRHSARSPRAAQSVRHPYAAHYDDLIDTVCGTSPLIRLTGKSVIPIRLWLPTVESQPLPSTLLLVPEDREIENETPKLEPWLTHGLVLRPQHAVEFLRRISGSHVLSPGVLLGSEFQFFDQALQLAASLVVRQKYIPSISSEQGVYLARWEPVLEREDQARLVALSTVMPPVVRAIDTAGRANLPPSTQPLELLRDHLRSLTDGIVRQSQQLATTSVVKTRGRGAATVNTKFDSVHDCWLAALRSDTGIMDYEAAELDKFKRQVEEWQQPVTAVESASFRLCFRLDEPAESSDTQKSPKQKRKQNDWRVNYLLQGIADPSLLIPVHDAWHNTSKVRSTFSAYKFKPREFLLLSLGQASRLSTDIASSLASTHPEGFNLDSTGAFDFLKEKSSALEEAGFGVMLPSWWAKGGTQAKLKLSAAVKSPTLKAKAGLSLDTIVQFDWKVAIGDVSLGLDELEALAELKTPLINVRGQWIHASTEEILAAIEFLKRKAESSATVRDVMKFAIGAASPGGGSGSVSIKATGWIADLLKQLEEPSTIEELATSGEFVGELRPYQKRGYSWLAYLSRWRLGACLADDMGLGKTVQTLAMIQQRRAEGEKLPVLLVCPTSVVNNWCKEASRFTPDLPVHVHHGSERVKGNDFRKLAGQQAIVISSYSLLHRDFQHLQNIQWAGVILDEAQNIKNPETKQALAARQLNSQYRIALTGTPVENSVGDLWSIMEFLNPGLLGSQTAFRKNFFYPIQVERDADARNRLKRITQPFILRRLKTDKTIISDLPDKQEMKVYCSLTKEQASLYSAVLKDLDAKLKSADGIQRKGLILATLSKLKQVCNHPAQFLGDNSSIQDRSGKLQRLSEMVEEILQLKEKTLIFSQFTEMGDIAKRHFEESMGEEVLFLHGAVSKRKRDAMVERFQSSNGPSIFVLSLKAGGTGLNLTSANHVFHFDRWWNPAVENQASDRAFRIGQKKSVQVHKFICAGTLEEKIDDMIESKRQLAEDIVGSGEAWLTELSNDELRQVFALSKEAAID